MEQEFRDQSKSIRLTPSPSSWETIRRRLDEKKQNKKVKLYPILAMAASITGVLLLVSLLFMKNNREAAWSATSINNTTEFEDHADNTDIYWQISQLNQAYTRLNMNMSPDKKNL